MSPQLNSFYVDDMGQDSRLPSLQAAWMAYLDWSAIFFPWIL